MPRRKTTARKSAEEQSVRRSREERLAARRQQRGDIGDMRNVLLTPKIDGYVTRWVNDELRGGVSRIMKMQRIGWEVVNDAGLEFADPSAIEANKDLGTGYRVSVGKMNDKGDPLYAVLMKIDQELYEMDQQIKEEEIRAKERSIREEPEQEGFYGVMGG